MQTFSELVVFEGLPGDTTRNQLSPRLFETLLKKHFPGFLVVLLMDFDWLDSLLQNVNVARYCPVKDIIETDNRTKFKQRRMILLIFNFPRNFSTDCQYFVGILYLFNIWDKVFKNGSSKICGRQPLKVLRGYGLWSAQQTISPQIF